MQKTIGNIIGQCQSHVSPKTMPCSAIAARQLLLAVSKLCSTVEKN